VSWTGFLKEVGDQLKNWGPGVTVFVAAWTWATGVRERRLGVVRTAYANYIGAAGRFVLAAERFWLFQVSHHLGEQRKDVMTAEQARAVAMHEAYSELEVALACVLVVEHESRPATLLEEAHAAIKRVGPWMTLDRQRPDPAILEDLTQEFSLSRARLRFLAKFVALPRWRAWRFPHQDFLKGLDPARGSPEFVALVGAQPGQPG